MSHWETCARISSAQGQGAKDAWRDRHIDPSCNKGSLNALSRCRKPSVGFWTHVLLILSSSQSGKAAGVGVELVSSAMARLLSVRKAQLSNPEWLWGR